MGGDAFGVFGRVVKAGDAPTAGIAGEEAVDDDAAVAVHVGDVEIGGEGIEGDFFENEDGGFAVNGAHGGSAADDDETIGG